MIHVYALDSRLDAAREKHLLRQLPPGEQHSLQRFPRDADRHRSLVGRATVRRLLGRKLALAAPAVPLAAGRHGKPRLDAGPASRAEFSISHSGDWVLVALADQAVGIDIEQHRGAIDPALLRACFTPAEQSHIHDTVDFYRYWTYKEAAIKAAGTGFSLEPLSFEIGGTEPAMFVHGQSQGPLRRCRVSQLPAPAGYSAALAAFTGSPAWTMAVYDVDVLFAA